MGDYGLSVKGESGSKRVELECGHQSGLLYVVPSEGSWVCSEDLLHAHSLAGFFKDHRLVILGQVLQDWDVAEEPLVGRVEESAIRPLPPPGQGNQLIEGIQELGIYNRSGKRRWPISAPSCARSLNVLEPWFSKPRRCR